MDVGALVPSNGPIVHAWTPSSRRLNPPSFIPDRVVSKYAKEVSVLPIKAGLGERKRAWKVAEVMFAGVPQMLSVVGDVLPGDVKRVVVYALVFEDMLSREIGAEPKSVPYRIKVFSNHQEFRKVAAGAGAANAASYYHPAFKDIVMVFDKKTLGTGTSPSSPVMTNDDFQVLLSHEFTHAYMDIVWGRSSGTAPLWFLEGMAEYFQHFTWTAGRCVGGALNRRDLQIIANNDLVPLEEFVRIPRSRMYGAEFPQLYAQAWAVTHYLQTYHAPMVRGMLSGDQADVTGFEKSWRAHLDRMMEAEGV